MDDEIGGAVHPKTAPHRPIDKRLRFDYMSRMINLFATYWYFSSSLAAGGLRSI
ncbi:hypothetical protein [Mesorhizobium erdmanii]|uniref:hypothetical protein n=1 Tax=Mesorhizobium erdmanii TaxID=1777866 RepID=UPI0012DB545D|nr:MULTISPECIES: hypothetical protein [Mesorhizobium]